jgi:membrane protein DedA with SNARE-associated domain
MQTWVIGIMNSFGYWGIFLLIIIENLFPPIPSEVILTFGGFMTTSTSMTIWGVIVVSTLGSVVGAIILYGFGHLFPPERLENWLDSRWGRFLHFKRGDVTLARDKFAQKGHSSVFFCRCLPVVRSLISIPAGMTRMGFFKFLLYTTVGSTIWNTVLVYLGAAAGASWNRIAEYMDTFSTIVLVVILGIIAILVYLFYKKRFAKKNNA